MRCHEVAVGHTRFIVANLHRFVPQKETLGAGKRRGGEGAVKKTREVLNTLGALIYEDHGN